MDDFIAYVLAFGRQWKALMGGAVSVILAGFAAPADGPQRQLLIGLGMACFGLAAYLVWRDEHRRVEALVTQLSERSAELKAAQGALSDLPKLSAADQYLDTIVGGQVSTLSDSEKGVFFKMITEGESPAGGMFQDVANKTNLFVRTGGTLRTKDGMRDSLLRWAETEAQRRLPGSSK